MKIHCKLKIANSASGQVLGHAAAVFAMLAIIDPSVPGVKTVSCVDDVCTLGIVENVSGVQLSAVDAAVVVGGSLGFVAPVIVVDLVEAVIVATVRVLIVNSEVVVTGFVLDQAEPIGQIVAVSASVSVVHPTSQFASTPNLGLGSRG